MAATPNPAFRRRVRRAARQLLEATANPDGPGLLLRGREYEPQSHAALRASDPAMAVALDGLLELAHIAADSAELLGDHPDPAVRRAAALLAARAYPLLASADEAE